jgi:hypothetical protein
MLTFRNEDRKGAGRLMKTPQQKRGPTPHFFKANQKNSLRQSACAGLKGNSRKVKDC